ncbi:MAG: EthD family reductase [Deltaproteobacteria bacterium]|nr:EthD family reductase [Deltaproteobacteria bacterium]MBW1863700.1 EthD family reductase [Deltaproteobacteria bacterium]
MFKVSVMYPNKEGATFDHEYYASTHIKLVEDSLKPFGMTRIEVDKGISGGGDLSAPYICIGHLYFETPDGYDKGIAEKGAILRGDIPNFTNITPIRQISKVLDK